MSKKSGKNKKTVSVVNLGLGSPLPEPDYITLIPRKEKKVKQSPKEEGDYESILLKRYRERTIPKVDEGLRLINGHPDISYEQLQAFYANAHVGEFVKPEGKFIRFEFGRMLDAYRYQTDDRGENEIIKKLTYANVSKQSFLNNINLTVRYINYFIEYFDDDDELMNAYLQLMFQLHLSRVIIDVEDFIDAVFANIATDSMVEKVVRLVEYNTDESLVKQNKVYDESIQLTVEHLKAIMGVSVFHKFVIPIVSHYYTIRKQELDAKGISNADLYFQVFSSFIPLFDRHYDISLYGKLYHTATTRISKTENQESAMWKRRNRFGTTAVSFTNNLMRDYMNDISQKAIFNQSAIIFIHVCFDRAIRNELIQPDKYEMSDMKMEASDNVNESFSRFDRWAQGCTMHSEKDRLRAYVAVKDSLMRMGAEVGIDFDNLNSDTELRDEFEYYQNNIKYPLSDTQMYIIQLYYASKLQSAEDIEMMDIMDMIKLIMIMKRDFAALNFNYLQFFISSTLNPSTNRMVSKNTVQKYVAQHPLYEDWKDEFADTFDLMKLDRIISELRVLLSTPIIVVDYTYTEFRDCEMKPQDVCVVDEFIRLLIML